MRLRFLLRLLGTSQRSQLALLCWLFACSSWAASGCEFDSSGVDTNKTSNATRHEKESSWLPAKAPSTRTGSADVSDAATPVKSSRAPQAGRKASKPIENEDDAGNMPTKSNTSGDAPKSESCEERKEVCNTIDDDCDDKVDEDCECPGDKPVACYDGPSSTRDVGSCHPGNRTCKDGVLGECSGSVLPTAEICNGKDDDCNGTVDDAPGLDADLKNCGRCGNVCGEGEKCCSGKCVNPATTTDVNNCGACGTKCTMGAAPGCCRGYCVDLLTDQTCGSCNNACGIFKLGAGFACTCKLLGEEPQCAARGDSDEWMLCK